MSRFNLSKYDIKHLRIFASVVEHEGVMAASHATGLSLSSVSRDLTTLEERLGIKLCERGRGGFSLTLQGEEIYRETVKLLSYLHEFEQKIQAARQTIGGGLNLGVIDYVVSNLGTNLVDTLAWMHQEYPEMLVNVSVHEDSAIDVLLRERRIDLGTTGQPAWLQPLQYDPAFTEEQRLYISRDSLHYERIIEAFAGGADSEYRIPYVARSYRTDVFQEFEQRHPLRVAGRGGSLESILASVLAGVGCALLPTHFIESSPRKRLEEIPCEGTPVKVQFYLAYRRDAASQPAIRAFIDRFQQKAG